MRELNYSKRGPVKKRATAAVFKEANIDTAGMDPEMVKTLAPEAARRVGAAGVRLETRNPLAALMRLFRKFKK